MSFFKQGMVVAGMLALAACGSNTKADNAAANARATAENQADMIDNMASNVSDAAENRIDTLENRADAVRDAGENRADSIERNAADRGPPPANTTGM